MDLFKRMRREEKRSLGMIFQEV